MSLTQESYYISAKNNEYYQIMAVINEKLNDAKINGSPIWIETLEKLQKELEDNQGDKVTPWQYNMILVLLLDYVPESIKEKF